MTWVLWNWQRADYLQPRGQREGYFEGLAEMMGDSSPADPGQLNALLARFDQQMVE